MNLGELFETEKLTQEVLLAQSDVSPYYEKACLFILDNWTEPVERLSKKQFAWAHKILEDLTEKRIEGKL